MSRRRRSLLVAALLVVSLATSTAWAGVAVGAGADALRQTTTFERDPAPDHVTAVVEYEIPDAVRSLTVDVPLLATDRLSLVRTDGFDRVDETRFRWDETTAAPSFTLHLAVESGAFSGRERGVEGDGWAFVVEPNTGVTWRYRGTSPPFEQRVAVAGEGYAAGHVAYLGAHTLDTARYGGEETTFVLGRGLADADLTEARGFLEVAADAFTLGVTREETTVFVLPLESTPPEHVSGAAVADTFWVRPEGLRFETAENTFAHEYAHTRLGAVGRGSARWLDEAAAEYYGHVFSLNYGVGEFDAFRASVTTERFAPNRTPVVLAEPDTWRGTLADYEKGAHVLAALDAEMRTRTDGQVTLADVFVRHPEPFESHAAFRRAVVETTGVPALGAWLDRYVTTDALPAVADDPALYVVGPDLDPDDDGLSSGRERQMGTDPFAADTDGDGLRDDVDPDPTDPSRPTATRRPTTQATPSPSPTTVGGGTPTSDDRTASETTDGTGRGFGPGSALVALLVAALLTRHRTGRP